MRPGDLVRFSPQFCNRRGLGSYQDKVGLVIKIVTSDGYLGADHYFEVMVDGTIMHFYDEELCDQVDGSPAGTRATGHRQW